MNYRHLFHAGNFADVAKHTALLACLEALRRKDSAFFVLDTHAGSGYYELQSAEARKSQEAERGVQRLIREARAAPELQAYFAAVGVKPAPRGRDANARAPAAGNEPRTANPDKHKRLAQYPGSPALIAAQLRPQDRAIFVEQLAPEARALQRQLRSDGKLFVENGDGYAVLKAQVPPPERRGLVLIDPSYENMDEIKTVVHSFADAYRRWATGVYLLWYPILSAAQRRSVHARFEALRIPKMLYADLAVMPDDAPAGLAGSGAIIVNPPFGLEESLSQSYRAIHAALADAPEMGYVDIGRLTPERL